MTLVNIHLTTPTGSGWEGARGGWVQARLHRREHDGTIVRLPAQTPRVYLDSDGRATLTLTPTTVGQAWIITEGAPRGIVAAVLVPDAVEVEYTDLTQVDPATLEPTAEPEPAWWAALEELPIGDAVTEYLDAHPVTVSVGIGDVDGLGDALAGKVGTDDPRLADARTPLAHSHAQADVTGLTDALAGKAAATHTHTAGQVSGLATVATSGSYGDLTDKPAIPAAVTWATIDKPAVVAAGATQAEARAVIGAGTSSLELGSTAGTAKPGDWQPDLADYATTADLTTLTGRVGDVESALGDVDTALGVILG